MKIISHERHVVGSEGFTIDQIVWQRFKRSMPELVELLLADPLNQDLSLAGPILPVGTVVIIPIPHSRSISVTPVKSLWD